MRSGLLVNTSERMCQRSAPQHLLLGMRLTRDTERMVLSAEQVPGWFTLHARTMDSALAGHWRRGSLRNSVDVASLRGERGLTVE